MVELQWRFAKDSEPFAIITSGQRMVLQMRQQIRSGLGVEGLDAKVWTPWLDVPVEGMENK